MRGINYNSYYCYYYSSKQDNRRLIYQNFYLENENKPNNGILVNPNAKIHSGI